MNRRGFIGTVAAIVGTNNLVAAKGKPHLMPKNPSGKPVVISRAATPNITRAKIYVGNAQFTGLAINGISITGEDFDSLFRWTRKGEIVDVCFYNEVLGAAHLSEDLKIDLY